MINAKLIIYDCNDIYKILYELNDILKYDLIKIDKKADLESHIKSLNIFLIISKKKVLNESFSKDGVLSVNELSTQSDKNVEPDDKSEETKNLFILEENSVIFSLSELFKTLKEQRRMKNIVLVNYIVSIIEVASSRDNMKKNTYKLHVMAKDVTIAQAISNISFFSLLAETLREKIEAGILDRCVVHNCPSFVTRALQLFGNLIDSSINDRLYFLIDK